MIETFEDRALLSGRSFSFEINEHQVVNGVVQEESALSPDWVADVDWSLSEFVLRYPLGRPEERILRRHVTLEADTFVIPNGGEFSIPETALVSSETFLSDPTDPESAQFVDDTYSSQHFIWNLRPTSTGQWFVLNTEGSVPAISMEFGPSTFYDLTLDNDVHIDVYEIASLSGVLFEDHDRDGVLDDDEQGLPDRAVQLFRSDEYLGQAISDDVGFYDLEITEADDWYFDADFSISANPTGSFSVMLVSNNETQTTSQSVPINSRPTITDIGVFRNTTVSGIVYGDSNGNGQQDANEPGLAGVSVYVDRNLDGRFTDADRPDPFVNPVPTFLNGGFEIQYDGDGVVRVDLANRFTATQGNAAGYATLSGTPLLNAKFGLFQNAVLTGQVFMDINGNGRRDLPSDVAAPGLIVQLDEGNNGSIDRTTTTVNNGHYVFNGVPRGAYRITLAPKEGVKQTAPANSGGHTGTVATFAQNVTALDFGVQRGKDVAINTATFDGKVIKFNYVSTQLTSPFNVGFFQSSDAVFDASDRKLELFIQINPQTADEQGSGEYTLREPYKHDPTKPFILVVGDPGKLVTEFSETNNAAKVTRIIDTGSLKLVGNFQYDPATDRFKSTGFVFVGFKPETTEPFFPLVTISGNVSYDAKTIYSVGEVTATVGTFSTPLFNGKWDLRIADQISTLLKPTALNLTLAGLGFKIHSLKLANPAGGLTLDSYVELTGKIAIPGTASEQTQFKPVEVEFTAENPLRLKSDGPSLAGRINLPPFKFELFGMEIETESVTLEYFHPRRAFRLQGKVTLNKLLPGLIGDRVEKVVADFADTNYLEVNHLGFVAIGSISVDKVTLVPNQYELRNLKFSFNTLNSEWRGEAELKFPLLPGNTTLLAGLGFRNSEINFISLGADHLNIPLPLPSPTARPVVLQKVQLQLDNLADVDPHAAEFGATVGISDSLELNIPIVTPGGMMDFIAGPYFRGDFTGKISENHLVGALDFTVMSKDFLNVVGQGELDWKETYNPSSDKFTNWQRLAIKAKGTLKAFKGAIEGKFDATYASDLSTAAGTRSLTGTGEVTFKFTDAQKESLKENLPEWVAKRLVDRSVVGKATLNFVDDGNAANDYLVVYGDVELPVIGRKTLGFRASLDGEFQWLSNLVEVTAASTAPPAAAADSSGGASFAGLAASETSAASTPANEFTIGAGQQHLLLAASWQNDVGDVPLEVVTPDGTVVTEADFESAGIALLTDFSTPTSKAIGISAPAAGTWIVRVANSEGLGDVVYEGAHESDLPTVAITSVTREDSTVTIGYSAADPDSDATVRFFYDTDGEGFDGVQFGSDLAETDSTGSTTWNVTNLPAGTYHLYAMIDDGNNAPVFAYAGTPVVIESLATSISGVVFEDSDASGIREDGEQPLVNWTVFLDANSNGVLDNPTSGNNVADVHATEVWTTSNATGEYSFANVTLGEHTLAVVNQTGFAPTFSPETDPLVVVVTEDNPQLEINLGEDRVPATISSLSQTSLLAGSVTGSNTLELTIVGKGFLVDPENPEQIVEISSAADPEVFVPVTTIIDSAPQLRAFLPADQLATPHVIRLRIAQTGVGNSNVAELIVSSNTLSIAATNASRLEGNTSTTPFTFTVTRTGDTSGSASVDFVVSGSGTNATNTDDFSGLFPTGTVTFAAGESSQLITIDVSGDTEFELAETFAVHLTNAIGTAITNSTASGTITNDDTSFSIAVTAANKLEGNTGNTPFTFTVTRNGVTTGTGSVKFAVTGSGTNPAIAADFAASTGTVNFAIGETSKLITINVKGETLFELDETFAVTLNTPVGGVLDPISTATGTILNDDTGITIAATDAVRAEGTGATPTNFTFTITRSGNLNVVSSVKLTTAANGSSAGAATATDFVGSKFPTGVVNFAIGEATKLVTLPVIADATLEGNEGFKVTLSAPTGATLGDAKVATGTIQNDDAMLSIAATSAVKNEGTGDASTPFTFTVTRTGDLSNTSSVPFSVTGSAKDGANAADFGEAFPTGLVEFSATEASKVITIQVRADNLGEVNEGFVVTLANPINASLGKASAAGTITNDDTSFSIAPVSATSANKKEGNSTSNPPSNTVFTFTVTRIGLAVASSVQFTVVGTGDNPADATDFTNGVLATGTLNFTVSQKSQTVTINIRADKLLETSEGFSVVLVNPVGATLLIESASGTILNDD